MFLIHSVQHYVLYVLKAVKSSVINANNILSLLIEPSSDLIDENKNIFLDSNS